MAGRVIGKSGETVKKMREASGAFVDIANSVRGATRRIITVKGTAEPITVALGLMCEGMNLTHVLVQSVRSTYFFVLICVCGDLCWLVLLWSVSRVFNTLSAFGSR